MGLWVPGGADNFGWTFSNIQTTRPAASMGATITPGNNAKGSWVQALTAANVSQDVFGVMLCINSNTVSAAARDTILDVGVDPAGGTSYSVLIPDLLVSCASTYGTANGGIWYYLPIRIKAGSTVAFRASVNNATVGTLRGIITVFGKPRNRGTLKTGTRCEAIGIVGASSAGTGVTSGTTSDGAWTLLGTTTKDAWFWQLGVGCNNATMTAVNYHADLAVGDATNKVILIENLLVNMTTAEAMNTMPILFSSESVVPAGTNVYGRIQCSGTAITGLSLAAYAVGG